MAEIKLKKHSLYTILGVLIIIAFIGLAAKNMVSAKPSDTQLVKGGEPGSNKIEDSSNVKTINLGVANFNYDPVTITAKLGQKLRIIGNMDQLQGCLKAFTIPQLKISKMFKQEDNVLEFTPTQKGSFPFTCSMGMGQGTLIVE